MNLNEELLRLQLRRRERTRSSEPRKILAAVEFGRREGIKGVNTMANALSSEKKYKIPLNAVQAGYGTKRQLFLEGSHYA
jgi:hypothetical protein